MPKLYPIAKPILMSLEAERAHGLTITALKAGLGGFAKGTVPQDPRLAVNFLGRDVPNPIGLAAGFDKNAEVPGAILKLGFGFTEVGTITPRPQEGNPKPRLFRLAEDEGVINRMGFNNAGSQAVAARLAQTKPGITGMVGVNIGANESEFPSLILEHIHEQAERPRRECPTGIFKTIRQHHYAHRRACFRCI